MMARARSLRNYPNRLNIMMFKLVQGVVGEQSDYSESNMRAAARLPQCQPECQPECQTRTTDNLRWQSHPTFTPKHSGHPWHLTAHRDFAIFSPTAPTASPLSLQRMSIYLGIGLALCSTACSATGYTLQKFAHNRFNADLRAFEAGKAPSHAVSPSTSADNGEKGHGATTAGSVDGQHSANDIAWQATGAVHTSSKLESEPRDGPHIKYNHDYGIGPQKPRSYWQYWQFPVGLAFLVLGTIPAAFVFGLAPQSTLAPLGSVTMILNTIFSWRFLGESFTRVDGVSLALMAVGTTVAVLFGKSHDPKYT